MRIKNIMLILTLGLIFIGCGKSEKKEKVVLTYVTAPLNVPSIVNKELKIMEKTFNEAGIEVEYAEITSGSKQTQALASGDLDILYAVGGSSVLLSHANGADIKILNMYGRSPKTFSIYSKSEKINSPEDLKGKKIAGAMGTNSHELLVSYLKSANMSIEDVEFINMSMNNAQATLLGGQVDAALVAGPVAQSLKEDGYHMVVDGEGYIEAIIGVALQEKLVNEHPEVVELFLKAQTEILRYMDENTEETLKIVAKTLDMNIDIVREMYETYDFSSTVTDKDLNGLQKTADFMLETKMIEKGVDVNNVFIK